MRLLRNNVNHIDFWFLSGAIKSNPKAVPSNVDAMLERHRRFLMMEFKRPGEDFGPGQKIFLRALAKKQDTTVWIVQGHFDREPIQFDCAWILLPSSNLRLLTEEFEQMVNALNLWHDDFQTYRQVFELKNRQEPTP